MHKKSEVIRKAILYEVSEANKDTTNILNDIIRFYTNTREQFKYEVDIKSTFNLNTNSFTGITDEEIIEWLKENEISHFYFGNTHKSINGNTLEHYHTFLFVNKEDVTAFKLKWSN